MPVDPNEPDTFGDDVLTDRPEETDAEAPEADTAEQHTELTESEDAPLAGRDLSEVNPADLAEQARVVELNEDDYR